MCIPPLIVWLSVCLCLSGCVGVCVCVLFCLSGYVSDCLTDFVCLCVLPPFVHVYVCLIVCVHVIVGQSISVPIIGQFDSCQVGWSMVSLYVLLSCQP